MVHIDIDRPSTWSKYRSSLCDQCMGYCCTMPVEIRADDLVLLGLASEDDIKDSLKKLSKRLIQEGYVRSFRSITGLFTLEQKANRDCIFLGENRLCKVYEKRPGVCRQFPDIGPRPGYCPARKKPS